jgi:acyl-[acyl-carrier-protein]-phospholipid O-acyltransferase/long-chain-fatty-acid--[acyl-carrier-protein] ligase
MADLSTNQIEILGREHIPSDGVLVIPNQLDFDDLLLLEQQLSGRETILLIESGSDYSPELRAHLDQGNVDALEFSRENTNLEAFRKTLHEELGRAKIVIFVPGAACVRTGQNCCVPASILSYLADSGAPLLPVFVDHPATTTLSFQDSGTIGKVVFAFGVPLEREAITLANFQENLLAAGEEIYSARTSLDTHLAYAVLSGLKKHGKVTRLIDGTDESELGFDKLLGAAIALSKIIKAQTSKERVGIILPPSKGGMVANVAVMLAGKIPVNLNFTAGKAAVESCIQQADIDRFITGTAFVEKLPNFAWPDASQQILLNEVLPKIKPKIVLWCILSKIFSIGMLAKMLGIPRFGGHEEAILLFTSGSSGDPKGVVLSHRNILANVNQFGSRIDLRPGDSILGCLPLFHSFGSTVTICYPLIEGIDLVTYPSPLEVAKLAELIEKYHIALLLATPTFLRGYLRKASKEQLSSIKLVVTGAEKLPRKVAEAFEKRFGKPVLEGYGLTETSPASNINLPDPEATSEAEKKLPIMPAHRPGSVGQMLPGVAIRITDPDTDEPRSLHEAGMIWLRGPNIFEGYLGQPEKTAEVIRDRWFRTGDIGRLDEDGFLYIEGRLSRFSKIGGEMVPHETVEDAINQALGFASDDTRKIAIVGIPDDAKGEALVLLTADPSVDSTELRKNLLDAGIAALWIPKKIVPVEEIPMLASGKLDIKGCENAATAA